jgi:SAM-dependent methyltransferase
MTTAIKRAIPRPVKYALLAVRERLQHAYYARRLFGRNAALVPPRTLMFDGTADYVSFKQNGDEFLGYYVDFCNLQPDDAILDVGAGIGRKTLPLTSYLSARGRYEGIEIVAAGVEWCQRKITPRYPQFHFQQIDVYNHYYHPKGTQPASQYRFPFADGTFDVVVLGSVFTHLLPDDMANYLAQTARVLKPGGRCLITYFLLDDESTGLIAAGRSSLDLRHGTGVVRVADPAVPERAVGYDEQYLLDVYRQNDLAIRQPIHYGSWCGRGQFLSYQDIVVAERQRS